MTFYSKDLPRPCQPCDGSGRSTKNRKQECPECEGTGEVWVCPNCHLPSPCTPGGMGTPCGNPKAPKSVPTDSSLVWRCHALKIESTKEYEITRIQPVVRALTPERRAAFLESIRLIRGEMTLADDLDAGYLLLCAVTTCEVHDPSVAEVIAQTLSDLCAPWTIPSGDKPLDLSKLLRARIFRRARPMGYVLWDTGCGLKFGNAQMLVRDMEGYRYKMPLPKEGGNEG